MSSLEAGDDVEAVTWAGARGPLRGYRGQRLGGEGGTRPAPAQHITHTVLRSDAITTTTTQTNNNNRPFIEETMTISLYIIT